MWPAEDTVGCFVQTLSARVSVSVSVLGAIRALQRLHHLSADRSATVAAVASMLSIAPVLVMCCICRSAASCRVKSAELKYGSLVAKVYELLESDELKDKQVS